MLSKDEIQARLAYIQSSGIDAYVSDLYRALGKKTMEELELSKDPIAKKAAEAAVQAAPTQPPKKRFVSQKTREKMSAAQKRRHRKKREMS